MASIAATARGVVATLWLFAGVYLGFAGYVGTKLFETTSIVRVSASTTYLTYEGLSFASRQDLQDFLLDETASRWIPWLPEIPTELMPLLACAAWGVFGAAVRLLFDRLEAGPGKVLLSPILGASMAIVIYFLAFLLPTVLAVGPHTMRAEVIVALSILSGIGYEQVFQWVQAQVRKRTSSV